MTAGAPTPVPRSTRSGIWQVLRHAATLSDAALVAVGGATGAVARWSVVSAVDPGTSFPWPTLLVNVLGCFVVGALTASPRSVQMLAGVGFAGGLTTFSTFAVETADLLDGSAVGTAGGYVAASVAGGVVAVVVGRRVAISRRSGRRDGTARC